MKTLKEICLSHGVRPKEREYVRRLVVEYIESKPESTKEQLVEAIK